MLSWKTMIQTGYNLKMAKRAWHLDYSQLPATESFGSEQKQVACTVGSTFLGAINFPQSPLENTTNWDSVLSKKPSLTSRRSWAQVCTMCTWVWHILQGSQNHIKTFGSALESHRRFLAESEISDAQGESAVSQSGGERVWCRLKNNQYSNKQAQVFREYVSRSYLCTQS